MCVHIVPSYEHTEHWPLFNPIIWRFLFWINSLLSFHAEIIELKRLSVSIIYDDASLMYISSPPRKLIFLCFKTKERDLKFSSKFDSKIFVRCVGFSFHSSIYTCRNVLSKYFQSTWWKSPTMLRRKPKKGNLKSFGFETCFCALCGSISCLSFACIAFLLAECWENVQTWISTITFTDCVADARVWLWQCQRLI